MKKTVLAIFAIAALSLGFTACEDVPAPYEIDTEIPPTAPEAEPAGDGTIANPFNTKAAENYVTAGVDLDKEVYVKGIISEIKSVDTGQYGNAEYYISEDGTTANQFYVYRGYGLNKKKFTSADEIKTGDKVVLCGKLMAYNGKPQLGQGNYIVKLNDAGDPGTGEGGNDELKELPYNESFATTLGAFKNFTTSGEGQWICDYSTAKASGYDNASQVTTAGTYYLVSPEINLEGKTEAHIAYEYILNYDQGQENQQVYITDNFNAEAPTEGWTLLNGTHTADLKTSEGKTDWNTFSKADVAVPAQFLGKKVRVAFRYNTNAESGSTWEVRNFSAAEGKPGEGGGNENPGEGTVGDPELPNGDFENWKDGKPCNWVSSTSASKGATKQSTDAHNGNYAVEVAGSTSGNNRLAYKELTLPAGTYTMKFYVKAATAGGGSVRPGYVPVENGTAVSTNYTYGEYVNDLTNTEWVFVEHSFDLTAETTINPVVMVSKKPGAAVLFDDFILTNAEGEEIIK